MSIDGSGIEGILNFCQVVYKKAIAGTTKITAKHLPSLSLFFTDHPSAKKIRILIEASSRKSMLSAKREVECILFATINSTKK